MVANLTFFFGFWVGFFELGLSRLDVGLVRFLLVGVMVWWGGGGGCGERGDRLRYPWVCVVIVSEFGHHLGYDRV